MKSPSIFNEVLGPIMRGPSSSHTAGPYHIATMARRLLGKEPNSAIFTFDPDGSFAKVFHQQGTDTGFTAGLLGWAMTDDRFLSALDEAKTMGLDIQFKIEPLKIVDHPNTVEIKLIAKDASKLTLIAKSIGGGAFVISNFNGWTTNITGSTHEILVEMEENNINKVKKLITRDKQEYISLKSQKKDSVTFLHAQLTEPIDEQSIEKLRTFAGIRNIWKATPIFFVQRGPPLFQDAAKILTLATKQGVSLGKITLAYESSLLGLEEDQIVEEILQRFDIMHSSVSQGLEKKPAKMRTLEPSAGKIFQAEAEGRLFSGSFHTRAAARALAACHTAAASGVVCAAPTAGAAGVLPGIMLTLLEDFRVNHHKVAMGLLAAAGIGLIVAHKSTFAAEVAGCQVEIGVAGAMAAAAVVEVAGGSARQAVDAAAITLQNWMGSVCDMVAGVVEIPCHTRNAVAASNAFVCADLILGGYNNPIPLDETIDAVHSVGLMLPTELKCTALGGLAQTPSAIRLAKELK